MRATNGKPIVHGAIRTAVLVLIALGAASGCVSPLEETMVTKGCSRSGRWTMALAGEFDGFVPWTTSTGAPINACAVWGRDGSEVYALVGKAFVYRSTDHGASWRLDRFVSLFGDESNSGVPQNRGIWGWNDGVFVLRDKDILSSTVGPSRLGAVGSYSTGWTYLPTWTVRALDLPLEATESSWMGALWGTGPDDLYLPSSDLTSGKTSLLHSSDAGNHWTRIATFSSSSAGFQIWSPRVGTVYILSETSPATQPNSVTPLLRRSTDGGRTWTELRPLGPAGPITWPASLSGYGNELFLIANANSDFTNSDTGYTLYHSNDGGVNWDVAYALPHAVAGQSGDYFLRKVFATPSGHVFAVGSVILHRGPGETSFQVEARGVDLADVWSDDCGEAFAVGTRARIYHRE